MSTPEGMIPLNEFAMRHGISHEDAIQGIQDGLYAGKKLHDEWFVQESRQTETSSGGENGDSPLVALFFVLAGLSLLGGLILCIELWPGDPGRGMEWKTVAYIPSITSLTVGIVQAALFTAIGRALAYLRQIVINTLPDRER